MRVSTKKIWLAVLMAAAAFIMFSTTALAKDDNEHWAAANIEKTYERGWVDKGDNFRPDDKITRGEFADMLWRALGSHAPKAACPFSDVPEDAFYRQAATSLYEDGIVKGYSDDAFGPLDSLTREQGFTLLSRAFKLTSVEPDAYKSFADWNEVSAWAAEPLSAMAKLGYVEGLGNNNCAPQKALTRAEMATLLLRVADGTTKELEKVDVPLATVPDIPAVGSGNPGGSGSPGGSSGGGSSGGGGGGGDSGSTTATLPDAPQNLTAKAGDGKIILSWAAPANNGGSAIIRYELSLDSGENWANIGNVTSYTRIGLSNGISYTFMVRAVNSVGTGAAATFKATPEAPPQVDEGGIDNPIEIHTQEDLRAINGGLDKHYILMADINITGSWTPIGYSSEDAFEGILDGSAHSITFGSELAPVNFVGDYSGLFRYIGENGSVKNLKLEDADLSGIYAASLACLNAGNITDCYATGAITGVSVEDTSWKGISAGLVAVNNGTVAECSFAGTVSGFGTAGGLIGDNWGSITNCYAEGNVSGASDVGGLAGESSGNITNCYFTGKVSAEGNSLVGGLVGENYSYIINSYADAQVTAASNGDKALAGGLAGENKGHIINCYATGDVSALISNGVSYVGGLVGENEGSIDDSVALNTRLISGVDNVGRIFGIDSGGNTKNNHANSDMIVAGIKVSGTLTDKNGMNVGWASFNYVDWWENDFWASVWGNSDTTPWQWGGDDYLLPILYWQGVPAAAPKIIGVVTKISPVQIWSGSELSQRYEQITIFNREGNELIYNFAKDFRNGYNALQNANSGADGTTEHPYLYFSEDGNDTSIHWDNCKNTVGETIEKFAVGDMLELVLDEDGNVVKIANYAAFEVGRSAKIQTGAHNRIIITSEGYNGLFVLNKSAVVFNVIPDEDDTYKDVNIMPVSSVLSADITAEKVVLFVEANSGNVTALYIVESFDKHHFGVFTRLGYDGIVPVYTINGEMLYGDTLNVDVMPAVVAYRISDGVVSIDYYLTTGIGADSRLVDDVNGKTIPEFVQSASKGASFAVTGQVSAYSKGPKILRININATNYVTIFSGDAYLYDIAARQICVPEDLVGRYVLAVYDKDLDALFVAAVGSDAPDIPATWQAVVSDVAGTETAVITVAATVGGTAWHNGEQSDSFAVGDTATLTALADDGYVFMGWRDENGEIVSKEAEYSFTVEVDISLTTVFAVVKPD